MLKLILFCKNYRLVSHLLHSSSVCIIKYKLYLHDKNVTDSGEGHESGTYD